MQLISVLFCHLQIWADEEGKPGSSIRKQLRSHSWLTLLGDLIQKVRNARGNEAKDYRKLINLGFRRPYFLGYDGPPAFGLMLPDILSSICGTELFMQLLINVVSGAGGRPDSWLVRVVLDPADVDKAVGYIGLGSQDFMLYLPQGPDGVGHPSQTWLKSILPEAKVYGFDRSKYFADGVNQFSLFDPPSTFSKMGGKLRPRWMTRRPQEQTRIHDQGAVSCQRVLCNASHSIYQRPGQGLILKIVLEMLTM